MHTTPAKIKFNHVYLSYFFIRKNLLYYVKCDVIFFFL